jgi:hypothetical protein
MLKTKMQDVIFTTIMATFMVYGMIVYNIVLATGNLDGSVFAAALHELLIMVPIAFVLEFFAVGLIAKKAALSIVNPANHPRLITIVISIFICLIMCPVMSFIATLLFKGPSLSAWLMAWILNLPMALGYQLLFCGPLVRLLCKGLFSLKPKIDVAV